MSQRTVSQNRKKPPSRIKEKIKILGTFRTQNGRNSVSNEVFLLDLIFFSIRGWFAIIVGPYFSFEFDVVVL